MRRYKSPAAILKAARKLVEDGRWTRGALRREDDNGGACYCALGAIDAVTKYDGPVDFNTYVRLSQHGGATEAVRLLAKSVRNRASTDDQSAIMDYNDKDRRKRQDVVKLFDRAIARAEGAK